MTHFSTAGLRQSDAAMYWREYVCKTYVPVELARKPVPGFVAKSRSYDMGRTLIANVQSSPAEYQRTRREIRNMDRGDYLLSYLTHGELEYQQNDRQAKIGAGDMVLFDTTQTYHAKFTREYEAIHLRIPRSEFDQRLPIAERVSAVRVAAEGQYVQLAATMLKSTIDLAGNTTPRQLAPTLLDLVALAFDEAFGDLTRDNSRYSRIVARAQEVILDNLFDPTFDFATVPAQIGVSSRTLSRAFAQLGMTPAKWMWAKRLDAAHEMLRKNSGLSVSEVAMACGFNDFSHFSRAFKAKFGSTPSSVLN